MSRIKIGNYEGIPVFMDEEHAPNKHVLAIGKSGCGKSVECQNIVQQIASNGGRVLIFDFHGSLTDDQIFPNYRPVFQKFRNDIYPETGGIPCPLFEPAVYPNGFEENPQDTSAAVADIFSRAMKLGPKQSATMRHACENVMNSHSYETDGIASLGTELKRMDTSEAIELESRLHPLFTGNLLVNGDGMFRDGINIIHLSRCALSIQSLLAEVLLSYVWRLANSEAFKEKEFYIFLDECQNYNNDPQSPLALAISEGRRMGVNLILATQMVLQGTTNAVQQRLTQCGLILYGMPASNRANLTAKHISPGNTDEWANRLRGLHKGEFVATGNYIIGNRLIDYPVVISAYEEVIQ